MMELLSSSPILAIDGLAIIGDNRSCEALVGLSVAYRDDPAVFSLDSVGRRKSVARALGKVGGEPAITALREMLNDEVKVVAEVASQALEEAEGKLGGG